MVDWKPKFVELVDQLQYVINDLSAEEFKVVQDLFNLARERVLEELVSEEDRIPKGVDLNPILRKLIEQHPSEMNELSPEEFKLVLNTLSCVRERVSDLSFINEVIGNLRTKLLDLTLRNPFIKFRDAKNTNKNLEFFGVTGNQLLSNIFKNKQLLLICPNKDENLDSFCLPVRRL